MVVGHIPRTLQVQLRGALARSASAGDHVTVAGIFLPAPFSGFAAIRAGLVTDTFLDAQHVQVLKKSYSIYSLSENIARQISAFARQEDVYEKLATSIAPEIHGLLDVKKALLLQMIGGCTVTRGDGVRIRGDINICLMGDPGVAKSQLLKHISTVAPRGVYTSGKGASGVGLTAAVLKDPVSREFVLEAGSLVLADMGICAIDEFDKMTEADRTAIHEVMEQQTISIAKAGITTSLNARTAILAAANPAFGRYNLYKSPAENINLPAALLSRFDLLFLLLDKKDPAQDLLLAHHVTHVHRFKKPPSTNSAPCSSEFLRAYISRARTFTPHIPPSLAGQIVTIYSNLRSLQTGKAARTYVTPRTLLAILRFSQALARLRFSDSICQGDVVEAVRLMNSATESLDDRQEARKDPTSAIFELIREFAAQAQANMVRCADVLPTVLSKGFTKPAFDECLRKYERISIWQLNDDCSSLTFL